MFINKKHLVVLLCIGSLLNCDSVYESEDPQAGPGVVSQTVSCEKHEDCGSGLCKRIDLAFEDPLVKAGTCVPQQMVGYVDAKNCKDNAAGTRQSPYCTISAGIDFKNYLLVAPKDGGYASLDLNETNSNAPKEIPTLIVGATGRDSDKPVQINGVSISGKSKEVWFDGITSTTGKTGNSSGFLCKDGARVGVVRSNAVDNTRSGIEAKNCGLLWVDQAYLNRNLELGVDISIGTKASKSDEQLDVGYHVTNSFFYDNERGGVILSKYALQRSGREAELSQNTLYKNGLNQTNRRFCGGGAAGSAIEVTLNSKTLKTQKILIKDAVVWDNMLTDGSGNAVAQICCNVDGQYPTFDICDLSGVIANQADNYPATVGIKKILTPSGRISDRLETGVCSDSAAQIKAILPRSKKSSTPFDYFGNQRIEGAVDAGFCQVNVGE